MSMHAIIDLLALILALAGFFVAFYIRHKKSANKPLICPLRSNCDTVIHSDYSRMFGVPVEYLGMLYYAIIAMYHTILLVVPGLVTPLSVLISLLLSTSAFVFSLYLTAIQAFVLKEWCMWCLTSASFCLGIFILTIIGSPIPFVELLREYGRLFTILHLLGVAIGVGAATITDVFFFKFLKDYKISYDESDILKTLSGMIWIALFLLVVSGVALFLPKADVLIQSGKFLTKMIAVGILVINGFLLNFIVSPKLSQISFVDTDASLLPLRYSLRNLAFALGAISFSSWYFIFVLGALRGMTFPFQPLLIGYLVFVSLGVVGSQIFAYLVSQKQLPQ